MFNGRLTLTIFLFRCLLVFVSIIDNYNQVISIQGIILDSGLILTKPHTVKVCGIAHNQMNRRKKCIHIHDRIKSNDQTLRNTYIVVQVVVHRMANIEFPKNSNFLYYSDIYNIKYSRNHDGNMEAEGNIVIWEWVLVVALYQSTADEESIETA